MKAREILKKASDIKDMLEPVEGLTYTTDLVPLIHSCLRGFSSAIQIPALRVLLQPWEDIKLKHRQLRNIGIRLTAYRKRYRDILLMPDEPLKPGIKPVEFVNMCAEPDDKTGKRKILEMVYLSGRDSGLETRTKASVGYISYKLMEALGRPKYKKWPAPYIVGCIALLKFQTASDGRVLMKAVVSSDYEKGYNRKLQNLRDNKNCNNIQQGCYECLTGRDECPLACRPQKWLTKQEIERDLIEREKNTMQILWPFD